MFGNNMNMTICADNAEEFAGFVTAFMQTYYRQELGVTGAMLWFVAFQGRCTLQQFTDAMTAYANQMSGAYRLPQPVPADILSRIVGGVQDGDAWKSVMFAVRHYGSYYALDLGDRRAHLAINAMGGWPEFCRLFDKRTESDLQREFMIHYSAANEEGACIPLAGRMGEASRLVQLKSTGEGKYAITIKRPLLIAAKTE